MEKFYKACNDKCFKCIFQDPRNQYLLGLLIEGVTGCKYNNMNYSNVEKNINMYIKRKYLDMNLDSLKMQLLILRLIDLIETI